MLGNRILVPDLHPATVSRMLSYSPSRKLDREECPAWRRWRHCQQRTATGTCTICGSPSPSPSVKVIIGEKKQELKEGPRNIVLQRVGRMFQMIIAIKNTFSILLRCRAYLSCALNCMKRMLLDCDSSVMLFMLGKNLWMDMNILKCYWRLSLLRVQCVGYRMIGEHSTSDFEMLVTILTWTWSAPRRSCCSRPRCLPPRNC